MDNSSSDGTAAVQSASPDTSRTRLWSVQVDRVDPGDTTLDASFSNAIYENLLQELSKSKQFDQVFRSGDRNAANASRLVVLKTVVQKYAAGSETRRAVTTVSGATKLNVHVQLVTREGQVLMDRTVNGNVRLMGDNLGATTKVAKNTAKLLKQSALPAATPPRNPEQAKATL